MSKPSRRTAEVFAALGDRTRLALVDRLSTGSALSIAQLSQGRRISRQAVTKHLRVLSRVGVVRSARRGRERLWSLAPSSLDQARHDLELISRQWGDALARLKAFVEA